MPERERDRDDWRPAENADEQMEFFESVEEPPEA